MASSPSAHIARKSPVPVNIFIAAIFPSSMESPNSHKKVPPRPWRWYRVKRITTALRDARSPARGAWRCGASAVCTGCCALFLWYQPDAMLFPPSVMVQEETGWMASSAVRRRRRRRMRRGGEGGRMGRCSCTRSPPGWWRGQNRLFVW